MASMPTADSPTTRTRSGNRRNETARLAVLHAADDLLAEHGFSGLTIESIAREAGVAKQTIYRWWPSKVEILLDTLIEDSQKSIPVPASKPGIEAIRSYLRSFVRFLTSDPAGKVLLALIAEAQHNPATAKKLHDRYLEPRRNQERELIDKAIEAGQISPRLSSEAVIDALTGPIIYRTLIGSGIPRGFVNTLIDDLLEPGPS